MRFQTLFQKYNLRMYKLH